MSISLGQAVKGTVDEYVRRVKTRPELSTQLKLNYDNSKATLIKSYETELPDLTSEDKGENALRIIRDIFFIVGAFLMFIALIVFAVSHFNPYIVPGMISSLTVLLPFFGGAGGLAVGGILALPHYFGYAKKTTPFKEAFRWHVADVDSQLTLYNKWTKRINKLIADKDGVLLKHLRSKHPFPDAKDKKINEKLLAVWKSRLQTFFFGKDVSRRELSLHKAQDVVDKVLYCTSVSDIRKLHVEMQFFKKSDKKTK
jgi:hypothetical protein